MNKTYYRFFGGLLTAQERWLNRMARQGLRLVETGKLSYTFAPCTPGQYQYRVEFVGQKSREGGEDYAAFLEEFGYRTFFKNINLNFSVGKVQARPWADQGGRLATNGRTYNRELLIVEGPGEEPLQLRTTYEDRVGYCTTLQRPWLYAFLAALLFSALLESPAVGLVLAAVCLVPLALFQREKAHLRRKARTQEW